MTFWLLLLYLLNLFVAAGVEGRTENDELTATCTGSREEDYPVRASSRYTAFDAST